MKIAAMLFAPLGDSAVTVTVAGRTHDDTLAAVSGLAAELRNAGIPGITDVVPAYETVTLFYEPRRWTGETGRSYEKICAAIRSVAEKFAGSAHQQLAGAVGAVRCVEIPVNYGAVDGPDLGGVAAHAGLTESEVIAQHSGVEYRVQAIGFAPGFPYLSGLPAALATPRRSTPRTSLPAGSVGIGGAQTGIYPLSSPGGWNLIGRTAVKLFDPSRAEPALLRVGDRVKFRAAPTSAAESTALSGVSGISASVPALNGECHLISDIPSGERGDGMRVINAGMLTTVQDLGRVGYRAAGVPLSGAMDAVALRLANLLVGNAEDAAGLEFTLIGPEIEFRTDTLIALTGAKFPGCPAARVVRVVAGQRIKFGAATKGCRGYLAIAGGVSVPPVLGSRSTFARAALGGIEGRALRAGDSVPINAVQRSVADHWWLDERFFPSYSSAPTVRVVAGAHGMAYGDEWLNSEYSVTPQSDRMGLRLNGPALARGGGGDLRSSAVTPGTIQLPPDGQPIVLMADAQTIGGYPQLAHAIDVDLPLLAQLRPGDRVRFQRVPLAEAHQLMSAREHTLALLREGLAEKFR